LAKSARWSARYHRSAVGCRTFRVCICKEAQDKLRAALRDLDAGLDLSAGRQSVAQYMTRWLADSAKPKLRPSTHKSYESYVRLNIIPELGRYQLTQLSPQHVQAFLNGRTAAGLSPRSVQ
jgi:hypothetical protein